jgi:penicillin-binding protein 2
MGQYKDGESIVHAWFAGYFPKNNPKYSIAVFIENGRVGGKTAGPIFQEIAREIMKKGF